MARPSLCIDPTAERARVRRDLDRIDDFLTRLKGDLDRAIDASLLAKGLDAKRANLEICNARNTASTLAIVIADLRLALIPPERRGA